MTTRVACVFALVIVGVGCDDTSDSLDGSADPGDASMAADANLPPRPPVTGPVDQPDPTEQAGLVSRGSGALPGGLSTSCEIPGHDRFTADADGSAMPMRSYFATCATDTDTPRMFVSTTLLDDRPGRADPYEGAPPEDTRVGSIFEVQYDPDTRSLVRTGNDIVLDQCDESHGIAVSADCSRVAVLCQRYDHASETETFTKDLTLDASSWLTDPHNFEQVDANGDLNDEEREERYRVNGEMWLLEYNGDFTTTPDSYVIHKAISGSHLGNHALVYAEDDNTYAASMFGAQFDGGGGRHSGDSFVVVQREGWTIDRDRGWNWQCGVGHTLHNRPVFHPTTGMYYAVCTTDYTREEEQGGGFFVKDESQSGTFPGRQFFVAHSARSRTHGGTHGFLPVADGLLGTAVGQPESGTGPPPEGHSESSPTQIALVSLGDDEQDYRTLRWMRWIVEDEAFSLGHPQLAGLGEGQYLLGYGRMREHANEDNGNLDWQIPWSYTVQVIDGQGESVGEAMTLDGIGWGEQDRWVSLGQGRVAWVYPAAPALIDRRTAPECSRSELALSVFHAP